MGVERVSPGARFADPDRWVARRRLRRTTCVRDRHRRVWGAVSRVRAGADDRDVDRRAGAPGSRRRSGHAELACDHHRSVFGSRAWSGYRRVDSVAWDRGNRRAARRRLDRRSGLLALDLRDQRALSSSSTLGLILAAVPPAGARSGRRVDVVGAILCVVGLGGVVFALIEQPNHGWSSPVIFLPLVVGVVAFARVRRLRATREGADARARAVHAPELRRRQRRDSSPMYAGLGILFFFLVIFLQQVAGYSALESGLATVPVTVVMFALSRRFGALADRLRATPLHERQPSDRRGRDRPPAAHRPVHVRIATYVLPAMLVFAVGLSHDRRAAHRRRGEPLRRPSGAR